ncbi:HNH endonuclease [Gluconobacter japonicus]|uniref:HNH endonuclease n=1 Tax=Gluconobacter japonicus TaxID=376620 RepID=UPI000AAAEF1C|nr:HNH endonuclease [Gluconobacter japonicus]
MSESAGRKQATRANRLLPGKKYYMWYNLKDIHCKEVKVIGWFGENGEEISFPKKMLGMDPGLTLKVSFCDSDEIIEIHGDEKRGGAVFYGDDRVTFHESESIRFWWVNHKQTYAQETDNGYLWSPKNNSNGNSNHFYDNMHRILPGDIIFSYAGGEIRKVGFATRTAATAPKPVEFQNVGQQWGEEGWLVPINWSSVPTPIIPKDKLEELGPLFPEKYSPFSVTAERGNQGAYLARVSEKLGYALLSYTEAKWSRDFLDIATTTGDDDGALRAVDDNIESSINNDMSLDDTIKTAQIQARRGQGKFRANLEEIETCCRVSGVTDLKHLRASHIKPWRSCVTGNERIDGYNGFLLSPNIDHLFDRGYITFSDEGHIIAASETDISQLNMLGCTPESKVKGENFTEEQKLYLSYHRSNVFLDSKN